MSPAASILIEALAPSFLVLGALLVALPWLNPRDERVRSVMVVVLVVLLWRYMFWRWLSTLPAPAISLDFAVGLLFVIIETLAVVGSTINLMFVARLKDRSAEVDRNALWLARQPHQPLVDVFICTYNEEQAILERTIIGALSLNHANKRVWVLDDGRREWLRDLAHQLGADYLTRTGNAHAKAGNINNGLLHVASLDQPPDFVAILDADFVPMPNFLDRTLPLFRERDVGIVQTPQHFINPDPLQSNLAATRVWPDEQRYFFDVVMASKDAWGAAFCCGTSSVIRFSAVWSIGGLPTGSVTEDYLLTLRLKADGYRTVYLNERLSLGLAPEGLKEYITQRSRWALGFAQICRGPLGPLRPGNGLTLIDRISLIDTFLYWFASYAFRVFGIIIPILYWLLDVRSVQADVVTTLAYFFPSFMAQIIIMGWMSQSRIVPVMSDVSQLLGASAILKAMTIGIFWPKGHKFQVTAKGGDRSKRFVQWPMLIRFALYLALTIAGVIWAFFFEDGTKLRDSSALCLFWSWYNIVILTIACIICIEEPRLRGAERVTADDHADVRYGEETRRFAVRDISLSGVLLAGVAPGGLGSSVTVSIAGLSLPAKVTRIKADQFALGFETSAAAKPALIRLIYSGRYSAQVTHVRPSKVVGAILSRISR
jgi:cellulose synthase (UDP-forming)